MKAILSTAPGGPDTLTLSDVPVPEPGPGEVRLTVRAVAVNYPDVLIIEDRYQVRPERPFSPGAELCGVVDATGEGVKLAPGQRVMALPTYGAMAQFVVVREELCHPVPDAVGDAEAASLQMTYGTALHGLDERGNLAAGERLLVLGAAGGVGIAAVELGAALGAHVVAAASTEEKVALAKERGAVEGIVYPHAPLDRDARRTLSQAFKSALGGEGADVVFDPVGGDYTEAALRATAWKGRLLIVGFPAGIAAIPANLPLLKGCDVRGVFWGAAVRRDLEAHHRAMDRLIALCVEGSIRPHIHATYPLAQAGEAIAALAKRGVLGKVIVDPSL